MGLGVPAGEVGDVASGAGAGFVGVGVGGVVGAKKLAVGFSAVQAVGGVEAVAGFVSQDAQAGGGGAAFDGEHLVAFKPGEVRVGKVKGNGNAGDAVGAEPFGAEPSVGLEFVKAAGGKLGVQLVEVALKRPGEGEFEIGEAQVEQLGVVEARPGGWGGDGLGFGFGDGD